MSQHLGDLEGLETLEHFRATLAHYRRLFRIEPRAVVHDLHPGYLSTRLAAELAESWARSGCWRSSTTTLTPPPCWPSTGWRAPPWPCPWTARATAPTAGCGGARSWWPTSRGTAGSPASATRPSPAGDLAARRPWRVVAGWLALEPDAYDALASRLRGGPPAELHGPGRRRGGGCNAPLASSAGRLFDAAAAVLGVRRVALYEGQAAMELESLAGRRRSAGLPVPVSQEEGVRMVDPLPLLAALGEGWPGATIGRGLAAAFHESVAEAFARVAGEVAREEGLGTVVLGGGFFQNRVWWRESRAGSRRGA